ncbi:glycerol-3-phosphate dehydrogenase/oxidase [Neobacillus mesonae]|uniref:glycerol-3-phosphate dehydrogenase/oxidase n=1 Tax=Neobacillus mesonae TaxID=1193713 RepID=UPI00203F679F|nr:glycerol-3-phosphate dehydrogenase/oxidase [Neobacillus mesonae]MCM3570561.1 glycerol-3-phosphate dehydrogenase/oxidase [Neobacillus mesonae]
MTFSSLDREKMLGQMETEHYDVLIIGGGITGCGIALDAVTRGMKTALVEMQDFGAGTSSRSTKLVHGGLRYLKQFEVKMVSEVGKERAIVYENGPHVTTPEWMLLPIYQDGTFSMFSTSIGLRVYDYLAGVKRNERRSMLSREETLKLEPLLKTSALRGGGYYVEYKTDDARLTIEVIKEAVKHGTEAVNYAKVESFIYQNRKACGVVVVDQISNKKYSIYADKIVNASGPWVDTLREKDQSLGKKSIQLTKGIHLVFDQSRFPLKQAIYFDTPDGRMIFAIPREGKTYVGTTDTVYSGDIANPRMTKADRQYVLDAIQFMFPTLHIKEEDIESSWTGLRPLINEEGKSPSEISRKDEIWISDSGLITIAGGKLTGYRKMAEMVVDRLVTLFKEEGKTFGSCQTKTLPISGGNIGGSKNFPAFMDEKVKQGVKMGLSREESLKLTKKYGANVDQLYSYITSHSDEAKESGLPLCEFLQIFYAITEEMAVKPIDFFYRRTGALLFDIHWVRQWKEKVNAYMSSVFQWTCEQKETYQKELDRAIYDATTPEDEKKDDVKGKVS